MAAPSTFDDFLADAAEDHMADDDDDMPEDDTPYEDDEPCSNFTDCSNTGMGWRE